MGEESPMGGFWRRLKKKVSEPFIVGGKRPGSNPSSPSPSRDNSMEIARMREAQEEENIKTRIKDIIRRDLLFYPTFRNALQGNSNRTDYSLRYAELYERYKDLYAPLLYDDPEELSDWDGDREDSMFLQGFDPKRAPSFYDCRDVIPADVAEADINWAKSCIEDKEIASELAKMQRKLRDRNEIFVLLTGGKRQVLGAGMKTVRWEQKNSRELADLFGSEDRAREVQQMDVSQKKQILKSIKAQIKELAKYQEEIAHHYAFCQEVLKRASDAPQIDSLVIKLRSVAWQHRDEWASEIGRELAKRREALEIEQQEERERERKLEEQMQKANSPRQYEEDYDPDNEDISAQTKQEESLLYEISSKARSMQAAPPRSPNPTTPSIHPKALNRLLSLEAGGSLHLPKMMAIDFSGEDRNSRPSLQQDEGQAEAVPLGSPATSSQQKFVSVRKKQKKPSLNEVFVIGKRENTIDLQSSDPACEKKGKLSSESSTSNDQPTDTKPNESKGNEEKNITPAKVKQEEEDFIILFKYDGKAYRCNEKEKSILERQVKVLDPSTFRMLLNDFDLEVFAVLDKEEPDPSQAPANHTSGSEGEDSEEEDSETSEKEEEELAVVDEINDGGPATVAEGEKTRESRAARRRRRRANNGKKRATRREQQQNQPKNESVTPSRERQQKGVELGGRVWTRTPVSGLSPARRRAQGQADKNSTMRDTMRKRMQMAYEEEINNKGNKDAKPLNWKRERRQGLPQI